MLGSTTSLKQLKGERKKNGAQTTPPVFRGATCECEAYLSKPPPWRFLPPLAADRRKTKVLQRREEAVSAITRHPLQARFPFRASCARFQTQADERICPPDQEGMPWASRFTETHAHSFGWGRPWLLGCLASFFFVVFLRGRGMVFLPDLKQCGQERLLEGRLPGRCSSKTRQTRAGHQRMKGRERTQSTNHENKST